MTRKLIAYFDEIQQAETVINELKGRGFNENDISIVGSKTDKQTEEFKNDAGDDGAEEVDLFHLDSGLGTLAGTGIGTAAGAAIGAGALLIPGVGPLIAAGPIIGGFVGAVTGGVAGTLASFGISEERSGYYAGKIEEGKFLLILQADNEKVNETAELLREVGAQEVEVH